LFFCGIEIENVLGSAVGARMPLRITINENNIKCLRALVAIERLFYGKNPFHLVVKARIRATFPQKKASPWSTQVRETETHSSIMSNPLAVVRALLAHDSNGGEKFGASRRFELHAQRSRNCQQARVARATGVAFCPVRDQV
jgi:hypothetical protein